MTAKFFLTFILLASLSTSLFGQSLNAAKQSADADLKSSLERYAQLQEFIKEEKIPLGKSLDVLNSEVRNKRREAERSQRLKDNSTVDLNALVDRVEKRMEQIDYVANLIADYGERFQRDISLPEQQVYETEVEKFRAVTNLVVEESPLAKGNKLADQLFIVETSIARFKELVGGRSFEGKAVVENGDVEQGKFLIIGPSIYFASSGESGSSGLALKTGILPPVVGINPSSNEWIRDTVIAGKGPLPIDPTLGSALALASQNETIWEHILKGGIWIWPILFFAFLATITSIFKLFEIYSVKMPKHGSLHGILKALNEGNQNEALRLAEAVEGPAKAMLIDAVHHSDESKELIEEIMYERMLEVQPKLERLLPFIAVTAATAPLMGLLGTVTGMINTFKLITIFGTGDAKQLSSGISEALVTTEFGLIVAIPSLIMHALLNRRVQGAMGTLERMAVAFVNGLTRRN